MNAKELASPTSKLDNLKERERRARLLMLRLYRAAPDGHDIRSLRGVASRLFNWIDSRDKSAKSVTSLAELGEKRKQLAEAQTKLRDAVTKRRLHQTVIAKVDALSKRIAQLEQTIAEIAAEETILRIYLLGHIKLKEIAEVYRAKTPHLSDLAILIAAYQQSNHTEEATAANKSIDEVGSGEDLAGAPEIRLQTNHENNQCRPRTNLQARVLITLSFQILSCLISDTMKY